MGGIQFTVVYYSITIIINFYLSKVLSVTVSYLVPLLTPPPPPSPNTHIHTLWYTLIFSSNLPLGSPLPNTSNFIYLNPSSAILNSMIYLFLFIRFFVMGGSPINSQAFYPLDHLSRNKKDKLSIRNVFHKVFTPGCIVNNNNTSRYHDFTNTYSINVIALVFFSPPFPGCINGNPLITHYQHSPFPFVRPLAQIFPC